MLKGIVVIMVFGTIIIAFLKLYGKWPLIQFGDDL